MLNPSNPGVIPHTRNPLVKMVSSVSDPTSAEGWFVLGSNVGTRVVGDGVGGEVLGSCTGF